jgi:hypothetical protein
MPSFCHQQRCEVPCQTMDTSQRNFLIFISEKRYLFFFSELFRGPDHNLVYIFYHHEFEFENYVF